MINSILEAISVSLDAEFGENYKIYSEAKNQGLKEPCFFISCINPTSKLFLGKRYFRKNQFCVQYFPQNPARAKEECNAVAERLFLCLEWLDVCGDLVMGTKMSGEVADGILHFFVNYDMFAYHAGKEIPVMEEISTTTSMKGTVKK